jgi:hypothetical protein
MELDDLKAAWAQYDKKLTENLKFNEDLLRGMNLEKSKKEMNAPLTYEIFSVTTGAIFLIYIISSTIRYSSELKFLSPGLIASLTLIIYLYLSFVKIRLLSNIDFYYSSVIELQKSVNIFKQKYLRFKKYELFVFPVFAISVSPILLKALRNLDLYAHPYRYIIAIFLSLILYYPLAIWFYKNLFDKKVRNTTFFLKELIQFEKNE